MVARRKTNEPSASVSARHLQLVGRLLPDDWRAMIGPDPNRAGDDRARLIKAGIPVWTIIGYLQAKESPIDLDAIEQVGADFQIPASAVAAAIAYYDEHQDAIDARLRVNAAAVS